MSIYPLTFSAQFRRGFLRAKQSGANCSSASEARRGVGGSRLSIPRRKSTTRCSLQQQQQDYQMRDARGSAEGRSCGGDGGCCCCSRGEGESACAFDSGSGVDRCQANAQRPVDSDAQFGVDVSIKRIIARPRPQETGNDITVGGVVCAFGVFASGASDFGHKSSRRISRNGCEN